ncbi:DUF3277 family protein [Agrobacterium sp. ICMP 6402]|uniref:DUF3277 family protein n=1 Tax=Agrobacterium sp. ICMP 6402 TaxID=2292443 RepID=UPI001295194D|nr:DUF3277 family protein [Agrobacterium sp. ICMP 6402]MQB09522.1 DUF3277 family protein [Agrobacterium sp. ICMP 6402]
MATYSFLDVTASIAGPGGNFSLGNGSGNSEEGITVTMTEDKNTMTIGADGSAMHSLHAGKSGSVSVRLLKTSPVNKQLMTLYNYQTTSSALHGRNTITIRDTARGDSITAAICAFAKAPDLTYAKDGNTVEWSWQAGKIDQILGEGV